MIGKDNKYKRSLRRHHRDRLKSNRKHYWFGDTWPMDSRQLGMVISTPHMCSGYCCGNPRKWFGELTIQERKAGLTQINH